MTTPASDNPSKDSKTTPAPSDAGEQDEELLISLSICVLTVSDTRNEENDKSGRLLAKRVVEAGHRLLGKAIVPDNIYHIRAAISEWIADPRIHVIITTGGTGITGRDGTPEAVSVLLDKTIEGFGEVFRSISYQEIESSTIQSRAMAGVANGTYLFCLPGSPGACRTAWDRLIRKQLDNRTKPCNLVELLHRLIE
ncbi:MAG: molybdenum cofactor biosynthesis protein B [Ectothiorhodospiraceae bacterium AqS1]|nr:molybdenum cofactor biosynthesis protein B [Ectothiorhodospiraceae bacterium AqS1]